MGEDNSGDDSKETAQTDKKKVSLETTILEFIEQAGYKSEHLNQNGLLPFGIYRSLREIGKYVDTIGDLKRLAEQADGFQRLKNGVYFNEGERLPYTALSSFGEKKLDTVNNILALYGIDPIPWITRKYDAWERQKERGADWDKKLKI